VLLRLLEETSGGDIEIRVVASCFLRDRFGGIDDYLEAVEAVWGPATSFVLERDLAEAGQQGAGFPIPRRSAVQRQDDVLRELIWGMPEPDFRLAVEEVLSGGDRSFDLAERISTICRNRGAPWSFSVEGTFEYVGDEHVEEALIRPALAAINRPEFAGGVRSEFEAARRELREGTPSALKQAVHEAGCSVESAMKVVLGRRDISFDPDRDGASKLFDRLEAAGVVPRHMQDLVLASMGPRNRRGGHGAGRLPHAVGFAEAEAAVAAAAGAIAYLASTLP
jgi:hypothetical protein